MRSKMKKKEMEVAINVFTLKMNCSASVRVLFAGCFVLLIADVKISKGNKK